MTKVDITNSVHTAMLSITRKMETIGRMLAVYDITSLSANNITRNTITKQLTSPSSELLPASLECVIIMIV